MKNARTGITALLAAAALTAYALAGLAAAGAETEKYGTARDALARRVHELTDTNSELAEKLRRGRADKDALIEALARERLGLEYPGETGTG